MTVDLNYHLSSLCGPLDKRVVDFLERQVEAKLDASYLRHIETWHGGIPGKQYFTALDGKVYRLGRFLTLLDERSELSNPIRPSWQFPERDIRVDWSAWTLIDQEGPSCRNLFSGRGQRLLPFGALYRGKLHPDENSLIECDTELVAFFYDPPRRQRPHIVVWLPLAAQTEYLRYSEVLRASNYRDDVIRFQHFTIPVAVDFDDFLELLRAEP